MTMIEYTNTDKTSWGTGPWQSEPDKRQWTDEATGLPCLIVRGPSGALCGYVGVSSAHPLHGKDCDYVGADVHGGLTFASGCQHGDDASRGVCHIPDPGQPDDVWWFGFDCAHAWDLTPASYRMHFADDVYRDISYVAAEVVSLAAQLVNIKD